MLNVHAEIARKLFFQKLELRRERKLLHTRGMQGAIIFNKLPSDFKIETSSSLLGFKTG